MAATGDGVPTRGPSSSSAAETLLRSPFHKQRRAILLAPALTPVRVEGDDDPSAPLDDLVTSPRSHRQHFLQRPALQEDEPLSSGLGIDSLFFSGVVNALQATSGAVTPLQQQTPPGHGGGMSEFVAVRAHQYAVNAASAESPYVFQRERVASSPSQVHPQLDGAPADVVEAPEAPVPVVPGTGTSTPAIALSPIRPPVSAARDVVVTEAGDSYIVTMNSSGAKETLAVPNARHRRQPPAVPPIEHRSPHASPTTRSSVTPRRLPPPPPPAMDTSAADASEGRLQLDDDRRNTSSNAHEWSPATHPASLHPKVAVAFDAAWAASRQRLLSWCEAALSSALLRALLATRRVEVIDAESDVRNRLVELEATARHRIEITWSGIVKAWIAQGSPRYAPSNFVTADIRAAFDVTITSKQHATAGGIAEQRTVNGDVTPSSRSVWEQSLRGVGGADNSSAQQTDGDSSWAHGGGGAAAWRSTPRRRPPPSVPPAAVSSSTGAVDTDGAARQVDVRNDVASSTHEDPQRGTAVAVEKAGVPVSGKVGGRGASAVLADGASPPVRLLQKRRTPGVALTQQQRDAAARRRAVAAHAMLQPAAISQVAVAGTSSPSAGSNTTSSPAALVAAAATTVDAASPPQPEPPAATQDSADVGVEWSPAPTRAQEAERVEASKNEQQSQRAQPKEKHLTKKRAAPGSSTSGAAPFVRDDAANPYEGSNSDDDDGSGEDEDVVERAAADAQQRFSREEVTSSPSRLRGRALSAESASSLAPDVAPRHHQQQPTDGTTAAAPRDGPSRSATDDGGRDDVSQPATTPLVSSDEEPTPRSRLVTAAQAPEPTAPHAAEDHADGGSDGLSGSDGGDDAGDGSELTFSTSTTSQSEDDDDTGLPLP